MSEKAGMAQAQSFIPGRDELERTNSICRRFIFTSFVFFLIGSVMGYLILARVIPAAPTFVHAHLGVYGWVTLLIFGVAYKLLPTAFANKTRVHSLRMAEAHFWMTVVGFSGLLLFQYLSRFRSSSLYFHMGALFGALLLTSGFVFVVNMWKTFKPIEEGAKGK